MKQLLNFFHNYIAEYLLIAIILAGIIYLAISQGSYTKPSYNANTVYIDKIFDQTRVHKVEIKIADADFQDLLAEPREKTKYLTAVTIDGEQFKDVAFSVRGNGSVESIVNDTNSNRYNYTLNFKNFDSNNSYYGLDKIILNGLYFEPSYMESFLALKMMGATGLDVPLMSFTELYINGEMEGLYLAIEAVDRSFLNRTGANSDAALFHPAPYNADWDRVHQDEKYLADGESVDLAAHPDSSNFTYGGSDLTYRGDDPSNYNAIFYNASTKYSSADEKRIIEGIESLSPVSEKSPGQYWDVSSVLKFFAANALVVNTDSYLSGLAQNYYLRLSSGKMSVIPWDNDRAFMANGYGLQSVYWDDIVNYPIDSLVMGITIEERPLWRWIVENPDYLSSYHDILQQTLDSYVLSGNCQREFDQAVELIRPYVYSDPTRIVSVEEFEDNVAYLRNYIFLRADSIQRQLWNIPLITKEEVEAAQTPKEQ